MRALTRILVLLLLLAWGAGAALGQTATPTRTATAVPANSGFTQAYREVRFTFDVPSCPDNEECEQVVPFPGCEPGDEIQVLRPAAWSHGVILQNPAECFSNNFARFSVINESGSAFNPSAAEFSALWYNRTGKKAETPIYFVHTATPTITPTNTPTQTPTSTPTNTP